MIKLKEICMLLLALLLMAACSNSEPDDPTVDYDWRKKGVIILCEGNYQAGNSTLSFYDPETKQVQNGVFQRVNAAKMGDTGQSVQLYGRMAYVAMEASGVIWALDAETFQVRGQLVTGQTEHMINPRYIHFLSPEKAYVTDLYAPYITIFNPRTMQYVGSIPTGQPDAFGYNSTEEMVQFGNRVFTNCWSYSNKILVIDTTTDEVCDSIVLSSWQPKSMALDARGKLWVITDGGYETDDDSFSDNIPHLYCIDASTLTIEQDQTLDTDNANVKLATNPSGTILYIINNDVYRMDVTAPHVPVRPFIEAERGSDGRKHFLYGIGVNPNNGEIYVADAVDYRQSGVVYRYSPEGALIDKFRVGITPNGFAFK